MEDTLNPMLLGLFFLATCTVCFCAFSMVMVRTLKAYLIVKSPSCFLFFLPSFHSSLSSSFIPLHFAFVLSLSSHLFLITISFLSFVLHPFSICFSHPSILSLWSELPTSFSFLSLHLFRPIFHSILLIPPPPSFLSSYLLSSLY
jgi:hypothetical protein